MQLFLFLNDLAGRSPFFDALARGVYLATVPILALVLLALLTLAPRAPAAVSRGKIALATVLALGAATLLMWGISALAQHLNLGTISPRPFMTRWVNLLIVEPQDNSFPCAEVTVAAILGVGIGFARPKWGIFAGALTFLLMVARLFCGSNYTADVFVGALLGAGLMLCALALCRAPRAQRARIGGAALGAGTLALTGLGTFLTMATMPRFESKLQVPWSRVASASPKELTQNAPVAARAGLQEGEGAPSDTDVGEAEALALSKRSTLFLPAVETYLRQVLTPRAQPFRLLDVAVAPVNWREKSYRAAALRFEIQPNTPNARRLVADRAATLVKAAFAADTRLDNVDVTAILRGDARSIDGSLMRFAGDEVPVFTASVQRKNLIVAAPRWANDPKLDGGSWLRARSQLWINDTVLPVVPGPPIAPPTPKPTIIRPAATPISTPRPAVAPTLKPALPRIAPTLKPTAKPKVTPTEAPPKVVVPTAKPILKPTVKPMPKPTPIVKSMAQPTIRPAPKPIAPLAPPKARMPKILAPKRSFNPPLSPAPTPVFGGILR